MNLCRDNLVSGTKSHIQDPVNGSMYGFEHPVTFTNIGIQYPVTGVKFCIDNPVTWSKLEIQQKKLSNSEDRYNPSLSSQIAFGDDLEPCNLEDNLNKRKQNVMEYNDKSCSPYKKIRLIQPNQIHNGILNHCIFNFELIKAFLCDHTSKIS